ncbi:MAG TPA: Gldg family protein [Steroidobacteraceae bacterium]|nr:Gldg family protein [Steroidobacteraceae bacterium]
MKRSTLGGGTLLALALLFAGITMVGGYVLRSWRIDLTQNRLYSTAPGTDRILKGLKEPINLYFFYSTATGSQIPQVASYAGRVRDLLSEFAARSNGKVHVHVVDPQPFSADEDRASELGVHSINVGGNSGNALYFGLAGTNSTDGHAAIDFLDPNKGEFLEYDLAKLVYQLSGAPKPVIGWLSDLPMSAGFDQSSGQPRSAWVILEQLQQVMDVRMLDDKVGSIDPAISVLVLVHPKHLTTAAQFAIDQFALRGGHILLFVDPLADEDQEGADPSNPAAALSADRSSHLENLLGAWGVDFDAHQVVADSRYALSVSARENEAPVRHLGVLGLDASAMNQKDVVTEGLSNINFVTVGHLTAKKGATTHFETLLSSSDQAQLMPVSRFLALQDPATLFDGFHPTGEHYTLAARVSGNISTAFPGGLPQGVTLAAGTSLLTHSQKPLELIVVADTDMLADHWWVSAQELAGQRIAQPFANNGDMVINALDNLAGSDDLISIRGRATYRRPFTRVEALRARADDRFRDKEQELEKQLHATEDQLSALQSQRADRGVAILTPDQEQALNRFQSERVRIRKELRDVRLGLDQDITGLGNRTKLINIVFAPLLFTVIAVLLGLLVRRRRRGERP